MAGRRGSNGQRGAGRRFGWGLADQAVSSLTNFAVSLYVARSLGAVQFGAFSLAYAGAAMLAVAVLLGGTARVAFLAMGLTRCAIPTSPRPGCSWARPRPGGIASPEWPGRRSEHDRMRPADRTGLDTEGDDRT